MQKEPEKKYDFRTILDLLFITANEIAYPADAPSNTPDKTPSPDHKKYSIFDWRNITDNQGWIPAKIDYTKFKPKPYYKDVEGEILQKHLEALNKKQNLLKQFKHYEDFDRLDYNNSQKSNTYENQIQKMIFSHLVFSVILSRILTIAAYTHRYADSLWWRIFKRIYFPTLPLPFIAMLFFQVTSPVNHEYFRSPHRQTRMYEAMAYDADAYQFNNDIKYSFKYPERKEFFDTMENVYAKNREFEYHDAIRYYKRIYGIVDPEPFWKMGKTENQKEII